MEGQGWLLNAEGHKACACHERDGWPQPRALCPAPSAGVNTARPLSHKYQINVRDQIAPCFYDEGV